MEFSLSDQELTLTYTLTAVGEDFLITVTGGEAHIGSVAVVFDGKVTTVTAKAHKDNFLTAPLGEALKHLPHRITICGGFHLDAITKEQIQRVLTLHQKGIAAMVKELDK